jgi:rubrerythrin
MNFQQNESSELREEQSPNQEPEKVEAGLRGHLRQVIEEVEQLRSQKAESGRVSTLETTVEELQEQVQEEQEKLRSVEEENQSLREEISSVRDRTADLEGDHICPACDGQIRAGQVREVYQEEVPSEGILGGSKFEGPVTEMVCPLCGENVDVEPLPDDERERLTDELRRAGVAQGDPSETVDGDDADRVDDVDQEANESDEPEDE